MPRVFRVTEIDPNEKELRKDYFDRHTPHVICPPLATRGEKIKVKIKLGDQYSHPDDPEHFISFIQLWNRETFLAEVHFTPGTLGFSPGHVEVDFYIVPTASMNLSALSSCTKHGLWQSESIEIKVNG